MRKIKVVTISYSDTNGAGLCAYRIHKSLQRNGVESTMLVAMKTQKDDSVICVGRAKQLLWGGINKLIRLCGLTITEKNKLHKLSAQHKALYTTPCSPIDVSTHPAVKEADVIHLHWVDTFLDYKSFFERIDKPIVWTLHDENLFFGIAHYSQSCLTDNELEQKYADLKQRMLSGRKNLGIVFLSGMMYDKFANSETIKRAKKTIIHNSVDTNKYVRKDKRAARKRFGISEEDIVLAFVATSIYDPRKGLSILLDAVEKLGDTRIKVLAVGRNVENRTHPQLISTGALNNSEELSYAYSASDYFVMPSMQEAFAQTPIEAMSCGLPAIVFPVSGTKELINEENGVRCENFTVEALVDALRTVFSRTYDSERIREDVRRRFSPDVIAQQYIKFYQELRS